MASSDVCSEKDQPRTGPSETGNPDAAPASPEKDEEALTLSNHEHPLIGPEGEDSRELALLSAEEQERLLAHVDGNVYGPCPAETSNPVAAPGPRCFSRDDLAPYEKLKHPVWVFDFDNKSMWWANSSAVTLWNASSLQDLLDRDFATDMSEATERRLQSYLDTIKRGGSVSEQWTIHPNGQTVTLNVNISGIHGDDGRLLLLKEGDMPRPKEDLDQMALRRVEMLRHLPLAVVQFDGSGNLMEQNPAASAVFGGTNASGPSLVERFVDRAKGEEFLRAILAADDYCHLEAKLHTANGGGGYFALKAGQRKDPVTSETVIICSARDVPDAASDEDIDKEVLALSKHPRIGPEEESREFALLSAEERLLAHVDVYGTRPGGGGGGGSGTMSVLEADLEELERELVKLLPPQRKARLHEGYTARQARQFLRIEGNDPKAAAERMARYWELRHRALGVEAADMGFVPRMEDEDSRRLYYMARREMADEADEATLAWAKRYIALWNKEHLKRMDIELGKISAHERAAFVEAERKSPDLVSRGHRLMFLRVEDYNVPRATHRLVKYWTFRTDLFGDGDENDISPVSFDLLMEEFSREMSLKFFQLLPGTDKYGRAVFFSWPGLSQTGEYDFDGLLRSMWYTLHIALMEQPACIEKGIVVLVMLRDHHRPNWNFTSKMLHLLLDCMPMKVVAFHDCAPPSSWFFQKTVMPLVKWVVGRRIRARYQIHSGSEERIISELEACGISRDMIPTDVGGELDFAALCMQWIEKQKTPE